MQLEITNNSSINKLKFSKRKFEKNRAIIDQSETIGIDRILLSDHHSTQYCKMVQKIVN